MDRQAISCELTYPKKKARVLGHDMAYIEVGSGDPIVFLHGNPTSSYLWRNILPYAERHGRCIAPDLIGMGDSSKLEPSGPDRYRFVEQREHLDALLEVLEARRNLTLVLHDWGSVLGFDWANRHRSAVRAIAYMEAIVRPSPAEDLPDGAVAMFEALRTAAGENLILKDNMYIETALPQMILRELRAEEMDAYRRPFRAPGESRRAVLSWCREVPFDRTPRDVWEIETAYADWLPQTTFAKLFVNAEPGAFLIGEKRDFCRTFQNQEEVTVKGLHFLQEDSPHEIGAAIDAWLGRIAP